MSAMDEAPPVTRTHFGLLVEQVSTDEEMEGVTYPTLSDAAVQAVRMVGPDGDSDTVLILSIEADVTEGPQPTIRSYAEVARVVRVAPRGEVPADGV